MIKLNRKNEKKWKFLKCYILSIKSLNSNKLTCLRFWHDITIVSFFKILILKIVSSMFCSCVVCLFNFAILFYKKNLLNVCRFANFFRSSILRNFCVLFAIFKNNLFWFSKLRFWYMLKQRVLYQIRMIYCLKFHLTTFVVKNKTTFNFRFEHCFLSFDSTILDVVSLNINKDCIVFYSYFLYIYELFSSFDDKCLLYYNDEMFIIFHELMWRRKFHSWLYFTCEMKKIYCRIV